MKTLIRVVGVFFVLDALPAAWFAFAAQDDIHANEMEIEKLTNEMAAHRYPRDRGEKELAASQQQIEKQKVATYLWFAAAVGALIVGGGMVLLPSSRKRKSPVVERVPAPNQTADGITDQRRSP